MMKGWETYSRMALSFNMFSTLLSFFILCLLSVFIAYNFPVSFLRTLHNQRDLYTFKNFGEASFPDDFDKFEILQSQVIIYLSLSVAR